MELRPTRLQPAPGFPAIGRRGLTRGQSCEGGPPCGAMGAKKHAKKHLEFPRPLSRKALVPGGGRGRNPERAGGQALSCPIGERCLLGTPTSKELCSAPVLPGSLAWRSHRALPRPRLLPLPRHLPIAAVHSGSVSVRRCSAPQHSRLPSLTWYPVPSRQAQRPVPLEQPPKFEKPLPSP